MKVSVCLTVKNEEKSIGKLLIGLLGQTKKADEIVIVDGGSTDKTVTIIRHFQKSNKKIRLQVEDGTRAHGRNMGVELARNDIIAMTDADCLPNKNWLKRITQPFINFEVDIVAGFYDITANTDFQRAESVFLGVMPSDFDKRFLPSTRSMAFRKTIWEKIGGFPEQENNSAEDTDFNYKASEIGVNYAHAKDARVAWSIPNSLNEFINKIYSYAKWDGKYGSLWHPSKKYLSHNVKAIFKVVRLLIGFSLLLSGLKNYLILLLFGVLLVIYFYWSFQKVYRHFKKLKCGLWGIVLQLVSDVFVSLGFMFGVFDRGRA